MAENEDDRFAHRDMLFAGLEWLAEHATILTINSTVPTSVGDARSTALAEKTISSSTFMGPGYVDAEEAEAHPLGKGDVVLYVNPVGDMNGRSDGAAEYACLLSISAVLYIVPVSGMIVTRDQPVFLGPWCISNLQPTGECVVPSGYGD